MYRRTVITALAAVSVGIAGCLGRTPPTPASSSTTTGDSESTTLRSDGITATFRVGNGQQPTDDTASATQDDGVVVTGTMDPTGCNRPALDAVLYNDTDAVIRLVIGVTNPYPDREVECGNASYKYTCRCVVNRGTPDAVEVIYNYAGRENPAFPIRLS